jgi:hypothetical protein
MIYDTLRDSYSRPSLHASVILMNDIRFPVSSHLSIFFNQSPETQKNTHTSTKNNSLTKSMSRSVNLTLMRRALLKSLPLNISI